MKKVGKKLHYPPQKSAVLIYLRSLTVEGSFWRKQENAAKYGARLRGWRATESDEDASQMSYVANGTRGYTATTYWYSSLTVH